MSFLFLFSQEIYMYVYTGILQEVYLMGCNDAFTNRFYILYNKSVLDNNSRRTTLNPNTNTHKIISPPQNFFWVFRESHIIMKDGEEEEKYIGITVAYCLSKQCFNVMPHLFLIMVSYRVSSRLFACMNSKRGIHERNSLHINLYLMSISL